MKAFHKLGYMTSFKLTKSHVVILCLAVALLGLLNWLFSACCTLRGERPSVNVDSTSTLHEIIDKQLVTELIPPNNERIIGTVLSIDSSYRTATLSDPCSKAPCRARVRVDSVLGFGAAFSSPVSQGQDIGVNFLRTLSPTEKIFPAIQPPLPGLHVGSIFTADIQAPGPSMDTTQGKEPLYDAYDYTVK